MNPHILALAIITAQTLLLAAAEEKEPLKLQLPAPCFSGQMRQEEQGPNIEPESKSPRPEFLVSKGAQNVAAGRPVKTSLGSEFSDLAEKIVNGQKEAVQEEVVLFKRGTQWIQVDLGKTHTIDAIVLWHDFRETHRFHDVIVQVSDDPEFKNNVQTLFNNDDDDSSSQGTGTDKEYYEAPEGKIVDGKGAKGRYVRSYTRGSTFSAMNAWQEIEVYAVPAK